MSPDQIVGIVLIGIGAILFFFRIRELIKTHIYLKIKELPILQKNDANKNKGDEKGGKESWHLKNQARMIIALLAAAIIVFFWQETITLIEKTPLVAIGIIIVASILLIGGDPQRTIQKVRKIAIISLVLLLAVFIFWPAAKEKNSELANWLDCKKQTATAQDSKEQKPLARQMQIPSSAVFVKTVMLNDRVCMERGTLDGPPPKFFVDLGGEIKEHTWPTNKKQHCATNKHRQEGYQLYIYAEPGQNLPVVSKTICLLDEAFKK